MKKNVLIVGGGTAGITVAARILRATSDFNVSIIEPSDTHFYQPLWTLVGAGIGNKEATAKPMKSVIPKKCEWIKDEVLKVSPSDNTLNTKGGKILKYDYLVVAPGIQILWDKVEGLRETIGTNGVCSNFAYETVDSTFKAIKGTKNGNALFTYPSTPIKCGGAPQKIMYLAEEYFRKHNVRENINVEFVTAGERIFGIPKYRQALEKIVTSRNINSSFHLDLVKIDAHNSKAYFQNLNTGETVEKTFSMIHVAPPMGAPEFIAESGLGNEDGWCDVDKFNLQHNKYKNIFSLGDASSLPTSKTGAAVRKEAPVLVANLLAYDQGREMSEQYNGYTSCPIVTGRGKLILAEFDYDGNVVESFPFNQAKERLSMYLLKKYLLPQIYWKGMLRGLM